MRIETEPERSRVGKTLQDQTGRAQEDERERHFRDHEQIARPARAGSIRTAVPA